MTRSAARTAAPGRPAPACDQMVADDVAGVAEVAGRRAARRTACRASCRTDTAPSSDAVPAGDILGAYLVEVSRLPVPTSAEQLELALACHIHGDTAAAEEARQSARRQMVARNLPLVVSVARIYAKAVQGRPLLDLIQQGNLGLIRAVELYDPRRKIQFSTYASYWIKQGIQRSLRNDGNLIRVPVHVWDALKRMSKGLPVTDGQRRCAVSASRVLYVHSLDAPHWEAGRASDDRESVPELVDHRSGLPDVIVERAEEADMDRRSVCRAMTILAERDPRMVLVITQRFGLDGKGKRTMKEIGEEIGVTKERVRQIEVEALGLLGEVMGPDPDRAAV